jgi:hypothetical protein
MPPGSYGESLREADTARAFTGSVDPRDKSRYFVRIIQFRREYVYERNTRMSGVAL